MGFAAGAHFPAFSARHSSLPPGTRTKFSCISFETTRISPHLPSPDFRVDGICWRGRPFAFDFSRGGAVIAPSRQSGQNSLRLVRNAAHLPAIAVRADSGDSGMMAEPVASFKNIEFL